MGLDVGDKTIGVALSDPMFLLAQAKETIKKKKASADIQRLVELINENDVNLIVVGLPKNMNNTIGPQSMKVMSFVDLLKTNWYRNCISRRENDYYSIRVSTNRYEGKARKS